MSWQHHGGRVATDPLVGRRIRALRELGGALPWDEDAEEGVRAEAFVREHLLALFAAGDG